MPNTTNKPTTATSDKNSQAEQNKENPPANVKKDENSGINNDQKPKIDRGDPAVNPALKGPGESIAAAADIPHQEGGLPAKEGAHHSDGNAMSEAEWDALPPQSARRSGYTRENRPPKTETF